MDWVDWLLSQEVRQFVFDHHLVYPLVFVLRLFGVTALELFRPARTVPYRRLIGRDILLISIYWFGMVPIAESIDRLIAIRPHLPQAIHEMPLLLRLFCYFLIADFGHYWIHRLMHMKHVWRIHKWHHSPAHMYWLAGFRATIPQDVIVNLPYLFAYSFLDLSPSWMELAIGIFNNLQNDWMHANIVWRSNWLEWLIVTPRYHHIHHSDKPVHYMANLGTLFTVWDRLFGTYVDPESVKGELSFGIGEKVPPLRLVLGV
ncbi:MAG TPA: sterol desaturase family protein [Nitrospira sp.]|nr:sterol desaturase family protein [Nitrospira sp.]